MTTRRPLLLAASLLCLGLAGCGSSSSSTSSEPTALQRTMNVLMFQSTTPPPADRLPRDKTPEQEESDAFVCPQVIIADGGAAIRVQAGQDSSGLRHQISILNVARECTQTGQGGFRLKVGAEGRILLGPAGGTGGTYGATLNMQVLRGTTVVARRSARIGGTIPAGQTGTDFIHVEDGIIVPPGRGDVEIIIGLGQGGAVAPARSRRR